MTTAILKPTLPATMAQESLIAEYKSSQTPASLLTKIRNHSYREVLLSEHPRIGELSDRSQGWNTFVLGYISAAIVRYLDFVGRRNTMDDEQVAETAMLLLETYPYLKMDEIEYFFHLCKTSHFGHLYDLNGATLLEWMQQYLKERNLEQGRIYQEQEKAAREAEERRRAEIEASMTEEERAETARKIEEIQNRLAAKFKV